MKKLALCLALALPMAFPAAALAHGVHDVSPAKAEAEPSSAAAPATHGALIPADKMFEVFGWDFDKAEIKTEKVADGLYVLFGLGGNIAVSIGEDGTLIVDDQFPQLMPKIQTALREIGSEKVDFVINTHWHFDHADGNKALGKDGSWIVSQSNSRDMMLGYHIINFGPFANEQPAYPQHALSDITFDTSMQFHINGQKIDLLHVGPAHTTGDAVVFFRGANAVHMGDVFKNGGYPFIDADNGGDLAGMIAFCQAVYDMIDDDTKVIPGHGPVTNRAKLARFIEVLTIVQGRVQALIDEGKTLDEVMAAKPTADFDTEFEVNPVMLPSFLSRVYASLTR